MSQARFRFYAELNDFLDDKNQGVHFDYTFIGRVSVKDAIEALGVPHAEVDLILVNSQSVDFLYKLRDQDWVSVYPRFETIDISNLTQVRPVSLKNTQFILDGHLRKLAILLRLLGFDSLIEEKYSDKDLAFISRSHERILLTRDIGLLKRGIVSHGYWVRETDPYRQVIEILNRFDLYSQLLPFQRCTNCNTLINRVEKKEIEHRISSQTKAFYHEFYFCPGCEKVYWKGSHYSKMEKWINQIRYANAASS